MDKLRALVVDDEPSVCEAVKAILELEGLDVTTTISSVDAVEMVCRQHQRAILPNTAGTAEARFGGICLQRNAST